MCCVLLLLALAGPRVALVVLWLFSDYLSRAFDGFIVPLLGFIVLPWTTIAWAIAHNQFEGTSGIGLLVIIVGVLLDIGVLGGGARQR